MTPPAPDRVPTLPDSVRDPLVLAVGAAGALASGGARVVRSMLGVTRRIPWVAPRVDGALADLRRRGADTSVEMTRVAGELLDVVVREVVASALRHLDLTTVVRERVDLDAIAQDIDVDAIASRIDLDAVLARLDLDSIVDTVDLDRQISRIDLIGLASQIIDGIDLPGIIRESTDSMSTEAVRGVRAQTMQADDAVAGFVSRIFGREERP